MMGFEYNGRRLEYFNHPYNHASKNDRTIEVPIALYHAAQAGSFLEIGCVLPNYLPEYKTNPWPVLDKYSSGCIQQDVVGFEPVKKFPLIISISTFEHIGFGESKYSGQKQANDPGKIVRAVQQVRSKMLAPGGLAVVTMPVGFNIEADKLAFSGSLFDDAVYFKRISADNHWQQCEQHEIENAKFGKPYPWGNGLVVGYIKCRIS